jgi:hypothetical protein
MAKIAVTFEGTKDRLHQAYRAAKAADRLSGALYGCWMAEEAGTASLLRSSAPAISQTGGRHETQDTGGNDHDLTISPFATSN